MNSGWYPDPDDPTARRYWDGQSWSAPLPIQYPEPSSEAPPPLPAGQPLASPAGSLQRKRAILISAGVVVLLIAAAVVALLAKNNSDENDRKAAAAASSSSASRRAASSEAAAQSAAESAAAASSSAQKEADDLQRGLRQVTIKALEASVKKDAKKDVNDGLLDGPIKRVECTPVAGGSTDILTDTTGEFRCIAVNKIESDGTESGYRFSGTINWSDGSYSWHLGD